jgi:hypothetical protein
MSGRARAYIFLGSEEKSRFTYAEKYLQMYKTGNLARRAP